MHIRNILTLLFLLFIVSICAKAQFPQFPQFQQGMFPFPQPGFQRPGNGQMQMPSPFSGGMGNMQGMTVSEGPAYSSRITLSSSNLPIIKIDTKGTSITNERKSDAWMEIIDNNGKSRNSIDDDAAFSGRIGIKLRGNSSVSFDQKRYTIETRDDEGNDMDVSLLGLPAESDWVLLAPYNDISMIRDILAFSLWNDMGHWGPHTRLCELTVNNSYRGVYILTETIKRSPSRLDIAKLRKTDNTGTELTGGYILRIDAYDRDDKVFRSAVRGVGTGMSTRDVFWTCYSPDKEKITQEQYDYIHGYIDETEKAIQLSGTDDSDEYSKYINTESFVDYFIHTEVTQNADGLKRSAYFHKKKQNADGSGGKLNAGPVWDYNLAFGNCSFCNADEITAWVYDGCETNPTPAMWKTLSRNTSFMNKVRKRYSELRKTVLSTERLNSFIDGYAQTLSEAQERHFAQFSDLLKTQSAQSGGHGISWMIPGGNGLAWFSAYTVSSYQEEIDILKNWLSERLAFLDRNWLE